MEGGEGGEQIVPQSRQKTPIEQSLRLFNFFWLTKNSIKN
jgi:hypothetical protein